MLIGLTSARRREKRWPDCGPTFCPSSQCHWRPIPDLLLAHIERHPDDKMTLARLPIFIFDLLPTFCPPASNVIPKKKWRWPDFSWPAQITYPHNTPSRQKNDVGPISVSSWHGFKKFFSNLSQMITTTCITCLRPLALQIANKLHRTALGCPFLVSFYRCYHFRYHIPWKCIHSHDNLEFVWCPSFSLTSGLRHFLRGLST